MKPLTHCLHCQAPLIDKTIPEHLNCLKYQNCKDRCVVDYFQYFDKSYQEENVTYITFNTPQNKFNLYVYFDCYGYKNIAHIYSNLVLKSKGIASPIMMLPSNQIDLSNLDKLEEKLSTLALFA